MAERIVFLVPGFFGVTSVGAVSYFEDVERVLGRALRRRGLQVTPAVNDGVVPTLSQLHGRVLHFARLPRGQPYIQRRVSGSAVAPAATCRLPRTW